MNSPELSAKKAALEFMLSIFRQAIPEIDKEAEIVFIHSSPWYNPEPIRLERYDIPGPSGTRYAFSIAYLPEIKRVFALRVSEEWLPLVNDRATEGDYYITQYDYYIIQYAELFKTDRENK